MILEDMGIRQCLVCGALGTLEATCAACAGNAAEPQVLRCPGWACPKKGTCDRFTDSTEAKRTTTWTEPPYDPLTGNCEDYEKRNH